MINIKYLYIGRRSTRSKISDYLPDKKNSVFLEDY